ncbi:hypothetical protein ACCO45_002117 [Purpureocillium lilacinum]|uniref:Uncharacterized protein n=1 Tax=Purpureocillium lilacinum TaxID=33203 RepID=A0ACC4E9U9_PURLI
MQTRTEQPPWPDKAWQGPRPANPRHSALRGPALQAMALETAHCGPVLWAAPRRNKRCTTVPQYVPSPPPVGVSVTHSTPPSAAAPGGGANGRRHRPRSGRRWAKAAASYGG